MFREDELSHVTHVEFKFMHQKTLTSVPKYVTWDWPSTDDICTVKVTHIFMGPSQPNL